MVYLVGSALEDTRRIATTLGIAQAVQVPLHLFPSKGPMCIISSNGIYHGDSLTVSENLRKVSIPVDVKIIFDRHADFNKPNFSLSGIEHFASHAFEVYAQNFLERLYVLGIEPGYQERQIMNCLHDLRIASSLPHTKLFYSCDITSARSVEGKRIHVSVDIDVIKRLTCINPGFGGESGPSLEELSNEIATISKENTLVAIDLVGFLPRSRDLSCDSDAEGLLVYKTIVQAAGFLK